MGSSNSQPANSKNPQSRSQNNSSIPFPQVFDPNGNPINYDPSQYPNQQNPSYGNPQGNAGLDPNMVSNADPRSKKPEAKPTMIQGSTQSRANYSSGGTGTEFHEEKKTQYVPANIAAVRNNEMQEDLPQFAQFVKVIVSAITYPVDPVSFSNTSLLPEKYEFTQNSNIFCVYEEERAAAVPRSEILRPYMILKEVLSNGWSDTQLPPSSESITKDPKKFDCSKIVWKKLSQVAPPEGFSILYDTNKPTAIKPGMLNDKAFQSALSILAEREGYLSSIFPDFNETSNSIIAVWLNQMGEWRAFVLDELFPYDKEKGTMPAFTSTTNETWVLILEKAFAKMYGGYLALEVGHPAHYIHDITGAPYKYFFFDDPAKCWEFFMGINRATTTIVAMHKNPELRIENENDIFKPPAYSYAILDFQEVQGPQNKEKLVKMRDPWREKTWKGDWSSNSPKWNPTLLKKLCPQGHADDVFWISLNDFVNNYGLGFTFSVYPLYQHCSLRLKHSYQRNYSLVLMNIPKNARMILKVSQADHHFYMNAKELYAYSCVQMMAIEVNSRLQAKRFITGLHNKGRDVDCEGQFEPGDYLVYIEVDWEQNVNREIVFSTYGETNAILYEINCKKEQAELIRLFVTQYIKSNQNQQGMIDYGYFGDSRVKRRIDYIYGYLCFYYENKSDLFGLTEKVRMESLFGLKIMPPFTDNHEFDVTVPAGSDLMVIYNSTREGQLKAHYKHISWAYLYPDSSEDILKRLVRARAKKVTRRTLYDKEINIYQYVFPFTGGFFFYYVNKTVYNYIERLSLDLFNAVGFDNSEQTYFEISLAPHAECLLKFKVKDILHPYSYNSRVKYKIMAPTNQISNQVVQASNQNPQANSMPKSVADMLAYQFQTHDSSQSTQVQPQSQSQVQNNAPPKVVSDMLAYQFQSQSKNQVQSQVQSPLKTQSQTQAMPKVVSVLGYQFQSQNSNHPQSQSQLKSQGQSQPPKVVSDMLAYQFQSQSQNQVQSPPKTQSHSQTMPKVVSDMLGYQFQSQGPSANQATFRAQNSPVALQGESQSIPKPVKDMLAYQFQGQSQGNSSVMQNPSQSSMPMPKSVSDMLAYHYGNSKESQQYNGLRAKEEAPKPVMDMLGYQMKTFGGQGQRQESSSPNRERSMESPTKPVSDMIARHMQMYGGGEMSMKSGYEGTSGQYSSNKAAEGFGSPGKGGEGMSSKKTMNPAADMVSYQMQNYGRGENSMSPLRK